MSAATTSYTAKSTETPMQFSSFRLGFLVSETIHNPPKKQLLCYTRQISPLDCYAYLIFEPKTKYISKILEAYG